MQLGINVHMYVLYWFKIEDKLILAVCMSLSTLHLKWREKYVIKTEKNQKDCTRQFFLIFLPKQKKEEYHKKENVSFVQSQQI